MVCASDTASYWALLVTGKSGDVACVKYVMRCCLCEVCCLYSREISGVYSRALSGVKWPFDHGHFEAMSCQDIPVGHDPVGPGHPRG